MSRSEYDQHIESIHRVGQMSRLYRDAAGSADLSCLEEARKALACLKGHGEENACLAPFVQCFSRKPGLASKSYIGDVPGCSEVKDAAVLDLDAIFTCAELSSMPTALQISARYFACGNELDVLRKCSNRPCMRKAWRNLEMCENEY